MAVTTTKTNKPINPRGNDQSPKGYNRAELYTGKALDFDGVNDSVNLDGFTMTGTTATFAFNVNFDAITINQFVFDLKPVRFVIGLSDITGNPFGLYDNSQWQSFGDLEPNQWHNVSISIDGTSAKMYLNGQSFGNETTMANAIDFDSATEVAVGSNFSGGGGLLNGQIAGFKIFNTALTAAQVADLYNNPEKIVPTGVADSALKLWLPMMEGAGTTAYDGTGNGNHGTISGATYVNGVGAPVAQSAVIDWNKSHNYIDKSEEFETASWSENRLVTITDDSFIAPDGSATATEIVENTANDSHFIAQTLSVTAGDYFISAYVKKRDYDWVQIATGGDTSRYANFNISTGATGNSSDIGNLIIEDKGNGWYRIGGKITTSATSFNYFIVLIQSDVSSRFETYTGTDKGQYIWGAQATKSSTLQPYLRNIGTSAITSPVLLPQGLTTGRDITGVNLFENVRKQGALNLDGNSWAEVHDNASLDITTAITLEAWVYLDSAPIDNVDSMSSIMTKKSANVTDSEAAFDVRATGSNGSIAITGGFDTGALQTINIATGLSIDQWYHIGITYDSGSVVTYLNGAQVNTGSMLSPIIANAYDVWIGRHVNAGGLNSYALADIAQPRIYNRALTAEEVERNYNAGKNIYK